MFFSRINEDSDQSYSNMSLHLGYIDKSSLASFMDIRLKELIGFTGLPCIHTLRRSS